jgi:hypothetical protein
MFDDRADKYKLAAEYVIKAVVEKVADNHGWSVNEALCAVSQLEIYTRLKDPKTSLWTSNPMDLAVMVETELAGEKIKEESYFM